MGPGTGAGSTYAGMPNAAQLLAQQQKAEADRIASLKAQGLNPDGSPIRQDFVSLLNPSTGLMKDQYQLNYGNDVMPDTRGIEAVRTRALATGPSAWANQALANQALEEQAQKNNTIQQGASAAAQARSSLASKYGLSPAASARLATQNMRSQMSNLQNVGFQGTQARGNINLQDQQMKDQFLGQLPGQENALAQIGLQNKQGKLGTDQFNINNAISQTSMQNAADLAKYHEQMQAFAAKQQGQAMRDSGGGGGGKK